MKIRSQLDVKEYWDWCVKNLPTGSWRTTIPLNGNTITYIFDNDEDATAFKLRFSYESL